MELMQILEKQYNETVAKFNNSPVSDDINLIRRNNFIQGLHRILGADKSGGSRDKYSYYANNWSLTFNLESLGDFREKEIFLMSVRDQINAQLT